MHAYVVCLCERIYKNTQPSIVCIITCMSVYEDQKSRHLSTHYAAYQIGICCQWMKKEMIVC